MRFETYKSVLHFQDFLNTDDAPNNAFCVIENSNLDKAVFNPLAQGIAGKGSKSLASDIINKSGNALKTVYDKTLLNIKTLLKHAWNCKLFQLAFYFLS